MKDILEEIIAHKRIEIARQKEAIDMKQLIDRCDLSAPSIGMRASLDASPTGIIAEFKRRSPSKGWIKEKGDVSLVPMGYEQAGAAALSILTDEAFFGGTLKDIQVARPLVKLPILRKDFILDEYQLYQAKAVGANAILLIAACLSVEACKTLATKAHDLGLEVLLEIHQEQELDYIGPHIDMVGVNNRNLGTFHTDVANSFRLIESLPKELLKVSESGISQPSTIRALREVGYRGFLIGETFMKTEQPENTLNEFIKQLLGSSKYAECVKPKTSVPSSHWVSTSWDLSSTNGRLDMSARSLTICRNIAVGWVSLSTSVSVRSWPVSGNSGFIPYNFMGGKHPPNVFPYATRD